jgi:hypothetical protein
MEAAYSAKTEPKRTISRAYHFYEDHRMRRLMRPALVLSLVAALTLPALADKAKDLYLKGQDAEARQHY